MTMPAPAFCVQGITTSGESLGFSLPGGGIQVSAAFSAVSGTDPSLTCYADALVGANWQQVLQLTALTAAGLEQGQAQSPVSIPPGTGQWRLRWVVSGTGALFLGCLTAAGI